MPELSTIFLFAMACLALNATPGPDMLLIATRSAAQGRLAGLGTYLGIAAGAYCHALVLALGLSQLFLAVPAAYDIVRYAGAAYLLFLAWQTVRSKPTDTDTDARQKTQSAPLSFAILFRQGLVTNILNPKVALFFLALFPQFIDPKLGTVALQIMVLATILNFTGLLVNGLVILAASRGLLPCATGKTGAGSVLENILPVLSLPDLPPVWLSTIRASSRSTPVQSPPLRAVPPRRSPLAARRSPPPVLPKM